MLIRNAYIPIDVEQNITYNGFNKASLITEDDYSLEFVYGPDQLRRKTILSDNTGILKTKYFVGAYEEEITTAGTRKIHYIAGADGLAAVYIEEPSTTTGQGETYYTYTDHLGSIIALADDTGIVKPENEQSFDPWGRRRNTTNWLYEGANAITLIDRGYTGHEHLPQFGIINMNGRMYDPVLGRMLSPDNYVQMPDFTQNFNRYAYCVNNPLKYTDPSGEFFLGTILTFVGDALKTAFIDGGLDPTSKGARQSAWRDFDPTASWSPTNKAWKIDIGSFKTDPNRNFWGRSFQLISRWTWELPQTALGKGYSHLRNMTGNVDDVSYYGGATLVNKNDKSGDEWGLTLGSYINSKNMEADPYRDPVFRHEYGHTLQSRLVGPLYLTSVGLPSLIGGFLDYNLGISNHDREWYETQANRMSYRYFSNHAPGALTALPWDDNSYPRKYDPEWYWIFAHPPLPFMWWLAF